MSNVYLRHKTSGDVYAVQQDDDLHIISACGPLHHSEVTQANIEHYNFHSEPELVQDMEAQSEEHVFVVHTPQETAIDLQDALEKTGIAEVSYDEYTATVKDNQGEDEDQYSLSIQKGGMPPFVSQNFDELFQVRQYMNGTHCPQPIQWMAVEPE